MIQLVGWCSNAVGVIDALSSKDWRGVSGSASIRTPDSPDLIAARPPQLGSMAVSIATEASSPHDVSRSDEGAMHSCASLSGRRTSQSLTADHEVVSS